VTLADRIRSIRKATGLSQEEVARRSNITLAAMSRLERGASVDPHLSTLRGIAGALEVPVMALLEEPQLPLVG
jgi:D-alanyl-D-alanine-carboxypeptidase/D-alanyl-D-alanine-endopeptidase